MARRYEFYVRVATTSHLFAVLTCEILLLFLPQEHKIDIFKLTCTGSFYNNIDKQPPTHKQP